MKMRLIRGLINWLCEKTADGKQSLSRRATKELMIMGLLVGGCCFGLKTYHGITSARQAISWIFNTFLGGVECSFCVIGLLSVLIEIKPIQKRNGRIESAKLRGDSFLTFLLSDEDLVANLGDIDEDYPQFLEWRGAFADHWKKRQRRKAYWEAAQRKYYRLVDKVKVRVRL